MQILSAAKVIKHRSIQLILNSGTELSKSGVLSLGDSGRGDNIRRKGSLELTFRTFFKKGVI